MAINISRKDKSMLLFIVTSLIVLWFFFSFLTSFVFSSSFASADSSRIISVYKDKNRWLNLSRNLTKKDLENRVILLDFWTYACVNCLHSIPEIKKLEKEFGNKLLVIGVHSGKFDNEKDPHSIKKAVLKYDLEHPVVNDSELKIWDSFDVKAWPSFVLINPRGKVEETYIGEKGVFDIKKDVKKLVKKYRYNLNREALPILLEKNKIVKTVLSYPTKITYAKEFIFKSYKGPAFFIANSGRNNILVTRKDGEVILEIGSKKEGFRDGFLQNARFRAPSGLLYSAKDRMLYVADTANHALRVVDFAKRRVKTLAGNGVRGNIVAGQYEARDVALASPSDLEFFPDEGNVAIANSGTHQILVYDIADKKIATLAGNGFEGIDDGKKGENSLAQTSDLSAYGGKLYFVDAETSSLRVLDKKGGVKTLLGKGLFDFGDKNGSKKNALLQHPLGLFVNKNGAYISDSFNHKIRKYEFSKKKIKDLFGGKRGLDLGKEMQFDEPDDIVIVGDDMFVVDTNNNRLVKISFKKMAASLVDVMPKLQLPKEGFLQYLPNLEKIKMTKVVRKGALVKINFEDGWKINEKGPSFMNLLEIIGEKEANLVTVFDWNVIKNNEIVLPELKKNKKYILQGTIYYCQDGANALCYIKSHEQEIEADKDGAKKINIAL